MKKIYLLVKGSTTNVRNQFTGHIDLKTQDGDVIRYFYDFKMAYEGKPPYLAFTDKEKDEYTFDFSESDIFEKNDSNIQTVSSEKPEIVFNIAQFLFVRVINSLLELKYEGPTATQIENEASVPEEIFNLIFENEIRENTNLFSVSEETGISVSLLKKAKYSLLGPWGDNPGNAETYAQYQKLIENKNITSEEVLLPVIKRIMMLFE